MAAEDRLQLEILAKMAESWSDTSDAMLTIAIGLFMLNSEENVVDLRIDTERVNYLLTNFNLDREYHTINGVAYLRVKLTPKEEVTSDGR